jgi:hypothetical protein
MDKGVSGGAVSIKQWDGVHLVHRLIFTQIAGRSATGGLPTRSSRVGMYQYQGRFVANEVEKRSSPPTLQSLIEGVSRFSTIDYVSKGRRFESLRARQTQDIKSSNDNFDS